MRHLILILGLALPGWAWEFSYSSTTNAAPTWNRPIQDLSALSGVGTNVEYHVQSFVAPVAGTYTLNSRATGNWDNYLILYRGAFNPLTPLLNAIAANDDFVFIGQSRIVTSLSAGVTYNLVTTGFLNSSSGAFSNLVSTPTPEPATWMLIALGFATLLLRRRLVPSTAPAAPAPAQSACRPKTR